MDPATHLLAGCALSRAGLNRIAPHAAWLLALAAEIPDVDIPIFYGDALRYLENHRGITHSLPALPVMALIPVLVVRFFSRGSFPWLRAYGLSCLGVLSHLLIDWTNIYGERLLWPFRPDWYSSGIVQSFDPWITGILFLAFAWPLIAQLVTSEMHARSNAGTGLAMAALLFFAAYDGARFVLRDRVVETLNSRIYEGGPPRRVIALPELGNPMRWTGLVDLGTAWQMHRVDLSREFDPFMGRTFLQADPSPRIEEARSSGVFRRVLQFNQAPLWQEEPTPDGRGGAEVSVIDLRFGVPGEGRYQAIAVFDANGVLKKTSFRFSPPGAGMRFR